MPEIKKLIEVGLPLDDINAESSREKSLRHGHPSTLHLWWARRPCATARAVLFAQLVDDPSSHPELFPTEKDQAKERARLFKIIKELCHWENSNNQKLLSEAKTEIKKYVKDADTLSVLDPFTGGGTIPLEGQRLGLTPIGHDLNPVALTIEESMLDVPCRFQNQKPVNPASKNYWTKGEGAKGLADDISYYGDLLKKHVFGKIGAHYPMHRDGPASFEPIAYIWARTTICKNPACRKTIPLCKSFSVSTVNGKEAYWKPIEDKKGDWTSKVFTGKPLEIDLAETVHKMKVTCPFCGQSFDFNDITSDSESIGEKLVCIVLDTSHGRMYVSPSQTQIEAANVDRPLLYPDGPLSKGIDIAPGYGATSFSSMFTNRQLTSLTSFSESLDDIMAVVLNDAKNSGMPTGESLSKGGNGAIAYSQAIRMYLAFVIDKMADYNSRATTWASSAETFRNVFGLQAIQRSYDFCESNPFSHATGSFESMLSWVKEAVENLPCGKRGIVEQHDATIPYKKDNIVVSTDPPYYDNVYYSHISDFFYIWLKWNLQDVFPDIFNGVVTPKDELVADGDRIGSKEKAKDYFEDEMFKACQSIFETSRKDLPVTVYYAYKQSSSDDSEGTYTSSGWETMLNSLIKAGFQITGTWPMRTEREGRMRSNSSSALASSIVIVCRARPADAPTCSKTQYLSELHEKINDELKVLNDVNIAPVDLQQAVIGPGMAIFSKYKEVIKADGTPMSVREALSFVNQEINSLFDHQSAGLDSISQTCLFVYKNFGYAQIASGDLIGLATAKDTSVNDLMKAGVISEEKGKYWLNKPDIFPDTLKEEEQVSVWSLAMRIVKAYSKTTIDGVAPILENANPSDGTRAKTLLYNLYQVAESKGYSQDAVLFNGPVSSWGDASLKSDELKSHHFVQGSLFDDNGNK